MEYLWVPRMYYAQRQIGKFMRMKRLLNLKQKEGH